jgi:AcrR family transcriptional regulator
MSANRVDVRSIRREQIVDAAIAVIAEQGIQHLSLSEIEKKTGMARGQLTYYFKTKEDILLAVFDRLIQLMHQRATASNCPNSQLHTMPPGWERACALLSMVLLQPPMMPAFYPLQYTFLSQIGHREDFRARLAKLYDEWRMHMAQDFAPELANKKTGRRVAPKLFASLVQAILHGLAMQRAADPDAFDREEMRDLVMDVLENYLRPPKPAPSAKKRTPRHNAVGNGHRRTTTASIKGQPS